MKRKRGQEVDVVEKISDVIWDALWPEKTRLAFIPHIPPLTGNFEKRMAKRIVRYLCKVGLLRERDSITPKDMRHLIGRGERLLRALSDNQDMQCAERELQMAAFKLSNTCKAWRKILKATKGGK